MDLGTAFNVFLSLFGIHIGTGGDLHLGTGSG
ncbi:hypothetical protein NRB20_66100 [Nocardia sp. RB20]|uniref:Uncharacterized protein n=1 Tax=Nocardia macrotermitis TaxID=2585198 RepID=A0A7K0DCH5_9NOCA|nr:hypothetical protein [Nocardia macrotermitis]